MGEGLLESHVPLDAPRHLAFLTHDALRSSMMKIGELRAKLATYSKDQLHIIIAEMYKAIPKAIKHDKDIDDILTNPDAYAKPGKRVKKPVIIDAYEVLDDTDEFIANAYLQNYFAPNTVIPKRQRPKWRFIARRLHNNLLAIAQDPTVADEASERLEKLYSMLCHACGYILFSAYDPFESVGIEQGAFFRSVMTLKTLSEPRTKWIGGGIDLIIDNDLNRYTLYRELMLIFLEFTKTSDAKEAVIKACVEKHEALKKKQKATTDKRDSNYKLVDQINTTVEFVFRTCAALQEFQRGIDYFNNHHVGDSKEVKLYILLRLLFDYEQKEWFAQEYQKAVKEGVKPRESLVKAFKTLQTSGAFPKYV